MKKTFVSALLLAGWLSCDAQSGYQLINTYHIGSPGGWDYPAYDAVNNKLYVSHSSQVNILNAANGDSVGVVGGMTGVHGTAFVPELYKGYISSGRTNSVVVFDTRSAQVLGQVAVGKNPDWIMYDDYSKKIITSNHSGGDLSFIDPATDKLVSTVILDGTALETIASDGAGKLFINAEDKNEIMVVDIAQGKMTSRWALGAEGPTGLAIDRTNKRLFTTCDKQLVVVDADNGKVVARVPIGDGCDGVVFDADNRLVLTSNGEGTITAVKQVSKDQYTVLETIRSKRGARTITIDQRSHRIFLPTADYEPLPADAPKNTRPKMVVGSFQVLVYQKQ